MVLKTIQEQKHKKKIVKDNEIKILVKLRLGFKPMVYARFIKSARPLAGFHFLIAFLKPFGITNSLLCLGISSPILGPQI